MFFKPSVLKGECSMFLKSIVTCPNLGLLNIPFPGQSNLVRRSRSRNLRKGFEMTACQDFMSSLGHLAGPIKCWERKVWPPTGQTSSKITHGERGAGAGENVLRKRDSLLAKNQ
jgi:hypothetical protein